MIKKFRLGPTDAIEPWSLLLQGIAYLDEAATIASEDRDIESLIELSKHVDASSDKLIQVYLMLTGEEPESSEEVFDPPPKLPLGFVKAPEVETEEECGCGYDEEEE